MRRSIVSVIALGVSLEMSAAYAAPQPGYQSYNGVTNDVGPDLATVIEYRETQLACDQYQRDLDEYLLQNEEILSQLSDVEISSAVMSEHEQFVVDNFVAGYDREVLLRCGKYQFFYETFDTTGPPKEMIHWMLRYYEDFFGPGFSNFGMYEDPNDIATVPPSPQNPSLGSKQLPLGITDSTGDFGSSIPVYSFSCAACHVKQMDDGNFAVGMGNTDYEYAKMISAQGQLPYAFLFQSPDILTPDDSASALIDTFVIPEVQEVLSVPVADARATPGALEEWSLIDQMMNEGSTAEDRASIASTLEQQRLNWSSWSGVMDFMTPPSQDDGAFTITRILNLANIVSDDHVEKQHGFNYHSGLGWHGGSYDLINFIRGFITITASDAENPESREEYNYWVNEYRFMPLVRYVETFDEPQLPTDRTFDLEAAERGQVIFDRDCTTCHNGPGGETSRPYAHAEVNVEDAHLGYMDLYWDDSLFEGAGGWETNVASIRDRFPAGETGTYTRGLKAPRFISMWDNDRLLHNGSVWGVEELLTCSSGRVDHSTQPDLPFSNQGHQFGCELNVAEKGDLEEFIRTFETVRNVGNKYNGQFDSVCYEKGQGGSQIITLEFIDGKRMDLFAKHFSDSACEVFVTALRASDSLGT